MVVHGVAEIVDVMIELVSLSTYAIPFEKIRTRGGNCDTSPELIFSASAVQNSKFHPTAAHSWEGRYD